MQLFYFKIKYLFLGSNSVINLYDPKIMNLSNAVAAFTYASGTTSFPIDLNVSETWYVVVISNNFYIEKLKNVTARITT
jgi:hypothetical protein